MNTYITLTVLKSDGGLDIDGTGDDTRLLALLGAVSRAEDRWSNRHFYSRTGTLKFDGDGGTLLIVPDLISIDGSGLKEDDTLDGTFNAVWATTDYLLRPSNADPTTRLNPQSRPYTSIEVNPKSNGSKDAFTKGQESVQVAGEWGYWRHLATATETLNQVTSAGTTGVLRTGGTVIEPGHTIRVDTEQMFISSASGTALTVIRAVNATVAATHGTAAVIEYYEYPDPVREVCLIETGKLWRRKDSSFASSVGIAETGEIQVLRSFDPSSRLMLAGYRRMAMG